MNDKSIKKAYDLAKLFIDKVGEEKLSRVEYESAGHTFTTISAKASGALRRASMDLTRALAEMRKP